MQMIKPCIYFLFNGNELVYIGKSDNVYKRIGDHIAEGSKKFDRWEYIETYDNELLEAHLISILKPKYNKIMPDVQHPKFNGENITIINNRRAV